MSEHFWKLTLTKFAPRLRARAIWKSKSLKTDGLGTFFELQSVFCVAGAGISTRCKIRGRRRSSWGLQKRWQAWWISRGSGTMRFAWQAQWFCALRCRCSKPSMQNPWKGCKFHGTEVLLRRDRFAWQLQEFVCLGSTFAWQAQYFWSIHSKIAKTYCNSEVKCLVDMSFLKEVSQKSFVFELQSFIFEGSLAEMLRFGAWKLHFWRKSRRKASFWSLKASILKEVSQKSFVFDLQRFNFEASLAEMLRFWVSKLHFWKKSRTKASFLIFKDSFLKEVLHKRFVFEFPRFFNFESHINWQPKPFESRIIWHPNHLNLKFNWQPTHLNLKSIDNQITWISDQLTTKPLESQINCNAESLESQINWQSFEVQVNRQPKSVWSAHRLTTKSFESHVVWSWHQLTFEPIELRAPPSYRFLIFGNFRHRLVR